ncbi:MAG TPA: DUF1552 domain-containing protein [Marinagarivorans sp.]
MKKHQFAIASRRSFIKSAAKMGMSSAALNAGLMGANMLWARGALAQEGPAPKRLITIHITNGAHPENWHAQGEGTDFTLPQGSAPLGISGIREHCVFIDGLDGEGGHGPHHYCIANDKRTSLDIYAAGKIGAQTPFQSLHLAAYPQGSLSRINGNGIPFDLNPVQVYDRMFPEALGEGERDWKTIRRQGIFGANLKMLSEFKKNVNATQRDRLDLHADSIQAMSERIQRAAASNGGAACNRPFWDGAITDTELLDNDALTGAATELRTRLSMDLISLAFKCDLTRVATFSFGHSGADVVLPGGFTWHDAQHGYRNELKNPQGRAWFSEQMVYLMNLLASAPDIDGRTLLDNTLIYLTSDMGNGSAHDNARMPVVFAGGLVNGGQAINMGGKFWNPVFDTIADALGIPLDGEDYPGYGHGAGPIAGVVKA